MLRHRRVLDWIGEQSNLDQNRIGVLGMSLGGFNALYLAAIDERVAAVIPGLAGVDLPYVLTHSRERRVKAAVDRVTAQLSISGDELESRLREQIQTRVSDLAPHLDASRIQMVVASFDRAIPIEKQRALHQALGRPEIIEVPTGHRTAALYIPYLRYHALRFFDQVLTGDRTGRTAYPARFECPAPRV